MKTYEGRVAAITGAASGIGAALAIKLAEAGCHLALGDIHLDALDGVVNRARTLGVNCSAHKVDVANRVEVEQYASAAAAEHGHAH